MAAVQLQTPSFFSERAIDRLAASFPPAARERLKANLRAFRSWVAEPAFRAKSPAEAVKHVLVSVGPSVQFKAEFLAVLAAVPNGIMLFVQAMSEELGSLAPEGAEPALGRALDLLQRAQRIWFRFLAFHPDGGALESIAGIERITAVLDLAFHADNLATVSCMAADGESGRVKVPMLKALCAAAEDYARRYHAAVRDLVEQVAPVRDPAHPFAPSSLADLLALPPYDGPAASVEEMDESIGALLGTV